jgi:hypothetical protein
VAVIALLVGAMGLVPARAEVRQGSIVFTPADTGARHGELNLTHATTLTAPFTASRLPGGVGAAAALVIRDRAGRTVWQLIVVNLPGFDAAQPLFVPQVHLRPGRYSFDLAGRAEHGIRVDSPGLRGSHSVKATTRSRASIRLLTDSSSQPFASAWVDQVQSPLTAAGTVFALASDAGPGDKSAATLCLARSLTAVACIEPSHLGSANSLSGPWLPPLPAMATEHAHVAWAEYDRLAIPRAGLVYRGEVAAGTNTWRGVLQLVG